MTNVLDRLRDADPATNTAGWSRSSDGEQVRSTLGRERPRRHGWASALVAAVVVVALAVAVLVVTTRGDSPSRPASAIDRLVHGNWRVLPASPLGELDSAQVISTSEGILVWGHAAGGDRWTGAIYRPDTRRWRGIAAPPDLLAAPGVWTGRELVVWNLGYAYDPRTDAWRSLPLPPIPVTEQTHAVAVDDAIVAVNASGCTPQMSCVVGVPSASLGLDTEQWKTISSPPVTQPWDILGSGGGRAYYWARENPTLGPDPVSYAYDPATDSWHVLDDLPASGHSGAAAFSRVGDSIVWVGWYASGADLSGLPLAPHDVELRAARARGNAWKSLSPRPHRARCNVETLSGPPGSAVVWCNPEERVHLLDVSSNQWFDLPPAPARVLPAGTWTERGLYALAGDGRLMVLR